MMRQSFFEKSGAWSKGLGWLVIVVLAILPHFVPVNSPLSDLTLITLVGLIGLYYLYSGVKKFRQRKAQQPQVRWYSQPAILVAIGMFFFVFVSLFLQALGHSTLDLTGVLVLLPTWICWLAALVILVRDWRTPKTM